MPRFFSFPSCPALLLFNFFLPSVPTTQRHLRGGERFFAGIKATLDQDDYRTGFFKITQPP